MIWAYRIPTWELAILLTGAVVLLGDIGLILFRPLIRRVLTVGNDVVFGFMGATGVIYALILGLLAVATWDSLKNTEEVARHEAEQVEKLDRDLAGYPAEDAGRLRHLLRKYLLTVIDKEWPLQRAGTKVSNSTAMDAVTAGWISLKLKSDEQKNIQAEALAQLNELYSYRRSRIQAAETALPAALWAVVIVGAVLNIGLTYMVTDLNLRAHLVLTTIFAAMVGLMIFMIVAVDHPLWGDVSVSPSSYAEVLHALEHEP